MKDYKKRVFVFLDDNNGKSFVIDQRWNKDELYSRISKLFNINGVDCLKIRNNKAIISDINDILENDEILIEQSNDINNNNNMESNTVQLIKFTETQNILNKLTNHIDTTFFIKQLEKKCSHLFELEEEDSVQEVCDNTDTWRQSEISILSDSYDDIENDYWNELIKNSSSSPFNINVVKEKHLQLLTNIKNKIEKHRKLLEKIKSSKIPNKAFIFDVEDNDDHLLYDTHDSNKLLGCSIEKLILKLTLDKFPDIHFAKTFLLTYVLYLSPEDLLMYLTLRWKLTFKTNDKDKYTGIRLRIYSALKLWATYAPHDLMELLKEPHELFNEMELNGFGNIRDELNKIISSKVERQLTASEENLIHDHYNQNNYRYSFNIDNFIHFDEQITSINDIHPIDIANQITIIQKELFDSIHPREFFYNLSTASEKGIFHSNIDRMIRFSNFLSDFTCTEILEKEDLSLRILTLNRFIHASKYCIEIGNYQGAYDIFSSLLRSPILGLKHTWNSLPKITWDEVNKLKSLFYKDMDCSYFRNLLSATSCKVIVPLINMFIQDINQLDDSESSVFLKSNMINFAKMSSLSEILVNIFSFQENECNIIKDNDIISYIKCSKVYDERKMFVLSTKLEHDLQT